MLTRRKLVEWSPHQPNQFLLCSNDLRLYEVKFQKASPATNNAAAGSSSGYKFSAETPGTSFGDDTDKKTFKLVAVNSEVQFPKCVGWSPSRNADPSSLGGSGLTAAGLLSGKVVLTYLNASAPTARIHKEFVPRHSRSCNALAWNPVNAHQIATGLDKVRNDFSTMVYDIQHTGSRPSVSSGSGGGPEDVIGTNQLMSRSESFESVTRPTVELANSETTVALAWLPESPHCLAIGTGVKWLRIYDLRGDLNSPPSVVAHSKAVYGVHFDPFSSNRFATFSDSPDGVVKLWDLRMLTDPVFQLNTNSKSLQQISWSPTRPGVLATVSKDELVVKLWDIKENEKTNSIALNAPCKTHSSNEAVSAISWHPTTDNRILTVTNSGVVEVVTLHVPVAVGWSPHSILTHSYGKAISQYQLHDDISVLMRSRVSIGYSTDISGNKLIAKSMPKDVKTVWYWMSSINTQLGIMTKVSSIKTTTENRFRGIYSVLHPTEKDAKPLQSVSEVPYTAPLVFTVYRSPMRTAALQLCGSGWDNSDIAISKLEKKGHYERAAALAIFHLDLRRAIQILQRGDGARGRSNSNLQMVGMILAGYSADENGLWRESSRQLIKQVEDPYLKAIFAFLTSESKDRDFRAALDDSLAISLPDRIGFACRFLPDAELLTFIDRITTVVVKNGDLAGIILTGLSLKGIDLLSNYVDRTADVQTACLLAQYSSFRKAAPVEDQRIANWSTSYRALLNSWQLWHERAALDIAYYRDAGENEAKPPAQIFARCNFCNQALALPMIHPSKMTAQMASKSRAAKAAGVSGKQRITACPACNKALPRCALCLMHIGVSIPSFQGVSDATTGSAPFGEWFTWCQTCRHGGHTKHIMDWFKLHNECPVTDCSCPCASLS